MLGLEFRRCMLELDVPGARLLWAAVHPGWDQPTSDEEMLILLHMARARAKSAPWRLRNYSKRWLKERERYVPEGHQATTAGKTRMASGSARRTAGEQRTADGLFRMDSAQLSANGRSNTATRNETVRSRSVTRSEIRCAIATSAKPIASSRVA
jgi:hypothetical protein